MKERSFQLIETNGIRLRTVVEGSGPLVILLHGWPQCWYLWRHQIDPLVAAGFQVAVPDQRGGVVDAPFLKLRFGKSIYFARRHPGPASIDGLAMNFERQFIAAHLLCIRPAQNGEPRLMPRTPLEVGDIIVPHEIAAAERNIAFAAIHHIVRT